jgi:hypothetical protein
VLALPLPAQAFDHPSPHTPALVFLSLPLGLLRPHPAAAVWLGVGLLFLALSVRLLWREAGGQTSLSWSFLLICAAVSWPPVAMDLYIGQIGLWLLFLLLCAWRCWRAGRAFAGGLLLGVVLALKLIAWPLALWLLLRRQWRSLAGVVASLGALQLAAIATLGLKTVSEYYLKAGPAVAAIYRDVNFNLSFTAWGWRLFAGTKKTPPNAILALPLYDSHTLAPLAAMLLPALGLLVVLVLAWRAKHFDTAYCLLICGSLLAAPVCWYYYLILLALPMVIVVQRLRQAPRQSLPQLLAAVFFLLLSAPTLFYSTFAARLGTPAPGADYAVVNFFVGLIMLSHAFAVLGWMCLLWKTDKPSSSQPQAAQ